MSIEKLHNEIQAWVADNRHLTIVDRANKVTDMFLTAENSMELVMYIQKRAALSYVMQDEYESPEQIANIAKYGVVSYTMGETAAKVIESDKRSKTAHKGAEEKNVKNKENKRKMLEIWATGKYTNRTICAEQECEGLGLIYATARNYLTNAPEPVRESKK